MHLHSAGSCIPYRAWLKHCLYQLQGPRLSALKELASAMQRQPGAQAAQAQIPMMWPALLQLLVDAQQLVRQAAAPVVGMLGALATRAGRPPGGQSRRQGLATAAARAWQQSSGWPSETAAPAGSAYVCCGLPASVLRLLTAAEHVQVCQGGCCLTGRCQPCWGRCCPLMVAWRLACSAGYWWH